MLTDLKTLIIAAHLSASIFCTFAKAQDVTLYEYPLWISNNPCVSLDANRHSPSSCSQNAWMSDSQAKLSDSLPNLQDAGFNDAISGIQVAEGKCLYVTEHADFRGKHLVLDEGKYWYMTIPYLMNNKISAASLPVLAPGVKSTEDACDVKHMLRIYQHAFGKGDMWPATRAVHHLNSFNDQASSVAIPPGLEITLFEHRDFMGKSITLGEGTFNLGDFDFNDKASSFRVKVVAE